MSYKVSAIIIPFCRNLLSPAMVAAFFVTSDDGLPGSCYKRAKKAMVASNWPQVDTGRLFPHWLRNFLAWCESFVTPDLSLSDVTCPHGKSSSIVFVKGKEQWHNSSNEIANRFLKTRDCRSARRLNVIGWCRGSNRKECAIFGNPDAVRILCPSTLESANGNHGNGVPLHCGTDRHIYLRSSPSKSSRVARIDVRNGKSGSTSSSGVIERLPQRPWVQLRHLTVVISRFSRCGVTMTFRYASDSRVQLRSPSMQSDHDFPIFGGEQTTFKSQLQNRYVKLPLNLHEKEEEVGGPEYDFHYYLFIFLETSSKHPRHWGKHLQKEIFAKKAILPSGEWTDRVWGIMISIV